MKLDTDSAGNLVISPTGKDSPIEMGHPQGVLLVMHHEITEIEIVEVFERAWKLEIVRHFRKKTEGDFP